MDFYREDVTKGTVPLIIKTILTQNEVINAKSWIIVPVTGRGLCLIECVNILLFGLDQETQHKMEEEETRGKGRGGGGRRRRRERRSLANPCSVSVTWLITINFPGIDGLPGPELHSLLHFAWYVLCVPWHDSHSTAPSPQCLALSRTCSPPPPPPQTWPWDTSTAVFLMRGG